MMKRLTKKSFLRITRLGGLSITALALSHCAGDFIPLAAIGDIPTLNSRKQVSEEELKATGMKIEFHASNFYSLFEPNSSGCAGDAKEFYQLFSLKNDGSPATFSTSDSDITTTLKPAFVNGVSVDQSDGNARGADVSLPNPNQSFACSYQDSVSTPAASVCATFDKFLFIDTPGSSLDFNYDTGYYSFFDTQCVGAGPITSGDPATSKALAGGVYFDLDRQFLEPEENLILSLTFIPMGVSNVKNDDVTPLDQSEEAIFKIHLMKTTLDEASLKLAFQPRYLTYADPSVFPTVLNTLSVFSTPTGGLREEQIIVPLSMNLSIDRIRIERQSGSGILISAALYRMAAGTDPEVTGGSI